MPPAAAGGGFKRSRALWDATAATTTSNSAWCRAIAYELQPVRAHELRQWRDGSLLQCRAAWWVAVRWVPHAVASVAGIIRQVTYRQWLYVAGGLLYGAAVRWIHAALDAGPVVVILTALTAIFTVGLSDEGNADGISAYSVFNKGFYKILGSVDADALLQQHVGGGGGGMMMMGAGMGLMGQELNDDDHDNNGARPPPPPADAVARRPPRQEDAANNNNNNNNTARRSNKKTRRRDTEQRREIQRQRQAAAALGFDGGVHEAEAMNRLILEPVAAEHENNNNNNE